jgi:hypothetical protein
MAAVEVSEESVEAFQRVLSYLVAERQHLRSRDAPVFELEANRKAIVAMQTQLVRALGRRYGSGEPNGDAAASRSTGDSRPQAVDRAALDLDP